ncbi:hypothetical protein [Pseudonocardia xinjiangensis]|uniref:Uncharacterized protein n=1 Tax=Pseudonocardia xinjiangensis TaxID=75289 RepID=A0ABX1R9E3_9PSEU|nr:hypothetical protein [Pseudonocardia xinjiangensis]NMH76992.1 hypothetical protein [Pseudonocardia xinjiangensis]
MELIWPTPSWAREPPAHTCAEVYAMFWPIFGPRRRTFGAVLGLNPVVTTLEEFVERSSVPSGSSQQGIDRTTHVAPADRKAQVPA